MPLLHEQIEFHNAAALEPLNGLPGLCPVRLPSCVRSQLFPGARFVALESVGIELRFVSPASNIKLSVIAHQCDVTLHAYCGDLGHSDHRIPAGTTKIISLDRAPQIAKMPREQFAKHSFAPEVWRIQINNGTLGFLGIDTMGESIHPPLPAQKPSLRWLAYGSSITHSFAKGYPQQAARRLRADVLNKGLSGNCQCEPALADHFAEHEEWDFATFELGINMRTSVAPDEFSRRVHHLIKRIRQTKATSPIFLLTHFCNLEHFSSHPSCQAAADHQNAYDQILRSIVTSQTYPAVYLIEGRNVLPDSSGLCVDLCHPSDYGHVTMGENLARLLQSSNHLPF